MIIKTIKKNRQTGTEIRLHKNEEPDPPWWANKRLVSHYYELECAGHGCMSESEYLRKNIEPYMTKPKEWCIGCIEEWPVEEDE